MWVAPILPGIVSTFIMYTWPVYLTICH
jgi:hypothetical protein